MAVKKDYYKILGVAPTASQDEIRKAYRMLSKKYHPDLNPHLRAIAEDKMKELVEAYNVLSNPEKRKDYDSQPQFRIRKGRRREISPQDFTRKPKFKKEPSLLERILSPFFKKKEEKEQEVEVDYKQAELNYTLGLSMADQEAFYEQAKEAFALATKYDPKFAEAYYNLGLMHYRTGNFDEARVNFQKVLQIDKDDQMARKMISLLRDDF